MYNYNAKAVAVRGALTRPIVHDLGEMAKTQLTGSEGGYISDRLETYRLKEILSFEAAYTQVTASEGPEGTFNTLLTATVEKLNILDILTVDRIVARLVALHRKEDFDVCPAWIIPLGSAITNLRIGSRGIGIEYPPSFVYDPAFYPTYDGWKEKPVPSQYAGQVIEVPRLGRLICCRLAVEKNEKADPSKPPSYLHRLTMLRVELRSPALGDIDFGGGEGNGGPP